VFTATGSSGGALRKISARGTITTISSAAYHSMVLRQPKLAMLRSKIGGQNEPAM
jgi:hypothetical protein